MEHLITGLHHVTAVSGDAQENIDFYIRTLGLRLVKKTVNFDNPEVYHFYFGDEAGAPGTLMTTFPYGRGLSKGRHGKGMVVTTAFSLAIDGIDYWLSRLDHFKIPYKHPQQRFGGEVFVYLEDYDGLGLELVFSDKDKRPGFDNGDIPHSFSIRGIHHVEMWLDSIERTTALLTREMNHHVIYDGGSMMRLGVQDLPGHYVDLIAMPGVLKGLGGRGSVHHVAFATPDAESQLQIQDKIQAYGLTPTEVKDRNYFTSIYFREPGGVLFEVATSGPGFSADEPPEHLGTSLMLPSRFEADRGRLEALLPTIQYPTNS